jgi:hypothetical protein
VLAFACPLCHEAWPVPDGEPGRVAACSHCGRWVLLPPWAPARFEPVPPPPVAPPAAPPDAIRVPLKRRHLLAATLLLLAAGGLAGGVWALWGTWIGRWLAAPIIAAARPAAPEATSPAPASGAAVPLGKEGEAWTLADLIAYLRNRGLKFDARETDYGELFGPGMFLNERGEVTELQAATLWKSEMPPGFVYVQRRKTPDEAREACARTKGRCFAWGRFYVTGDAGFVEKVRQALP